MIKQRIRKNKKFELKLVEKDMSQTELACRLGVSQQLVSCWVNGRSNPKIQIIDAIAYELGMTIADCLEMFSDR